MSRVVKYQRYQRGKRRRRLPYIVYRLLPIVIIMGAIAAADYAERGWAFISSKVPPITASSASPANQTLVGRATVIDGDTIEIAGQRIRFNGIDAPESAQRCQDASGNSYACGRLAANALDEFLAPLSLQAASIDQTDGLRITLVNGEIVHLRPSGNAPELRCYAEAASQARASELAQRCLSRVVAEA